MTKSTLVIAFLVVIPQVFGECIKSYTISCESASEYLQLKEEPFSQVLIESKKVDQPPKESVDLGIFENVVSLTIVGRINNLSPIDGNRCIFNLYLKIVTLYDNEIRELKRNVFPSKAKIYKLSLVKNRIQTIEQYTFSDDQAEIIDLSENEIEILDPMVFTSPYSTNRTRVIFLRKNKLVTLEKDTFPPTLEILDMQQNSLSFIEEDFFENLQFLQILKLNQNKFQTVPSTRFLPSLRVFNISQNRISRLKANLFESNQDLVEVNLSRNKISHINSKSFLDVKWSLNTVDLSYNKITEINFLQPLLHNSRIKVSLKYNLLEFIDLEQFKGKLNYLSLILYGNPWRCSNWTTMAKMIIEKEIGIDYCDELIISSGDYPYCVDDLDIYYDNLIVERFIHESKKAVPRGRCGWNPRYLANFDPGFGCVYSMTG